MPRRRMIGSWSLAPGHVRSRSLQRRWRRRHPARSPGRSALTTEAVVRWPTDSDPPLTRSPSRQPTTAMVTAKKEAPSRCRRRTSSSRPLPARRFMKTSGGMPRVTQDMTIAAEQPHHVREKGEAGQHEHERQHPGAPPSTSIGSRPSARMASTSSFKLHRADLRGEGRARPARRPRSRSAGCPIRAEWKSRPGSRRRSAPRTWPIDRPPDRR